MINYFNNSDNIWQKNMAKNVLLQFKVFFLQIFAYICIIGQRVADDLWLAFFRSLVSS